MSALQIQIGDIVRFKVAYYNSDFQIKEDTDEILEGVVVSARAGGLEVKVDDNNDTPYFVTPDRVIKEAR